MKLNKLYLESIAHLPAHTRHFCLHEAPHSFIDATTVPEELRFLSGSLVDLGFENLGLDRHARWGLMKALGGHGVKVPGLPFRLRTDARGWLVVEPSHGGEEAELPVGWQEAVLVWGNDNQPSYIGSKVRPDQVNY